MSMTPAALDRHFSDAGRAESQRIKDTGDALAEAHFVRGGRLTDKEKQALTHWSMWGSSGYPVIKIGRKWSYDHPAAPLAPLCRTKREAVMAWEILIAKWVRMSGLEAQERAIAERSARLDVNRVRDLRTSSERHRQDRQLHPNTNWADPTE